MRVLAFVIALALSGCATASTVPINTPLGGLRADVIGREAVGEDLIVLALSGGGARAASFHLGVLYGLREMQGRDGLPLSEHIAMITSVSGGSIVAAHYWLRGDEGLDDFEEFYLERATRWNVRGIGSPAGLSGALGGGLNGPDQLAAWLETNVYGGATMGTTGHGPRVVINATDLYNSTPFAFTQFFFDGICSDVRQVRVADAVAASMAVPVAFRPVLVESYGGACEGPPDWTARVLADRAASANVQQTAWAFLNYRGETQAGQRYLHLADGGVADNLGLLSMQVMRAAEGAPFPLTHREVLQARRVLVLVVNAEYIRPREFQREGTDAIGAMEMIYAPLDVATEVSKRASLDVWREQMPELERDLRAYRCAQPGAGADCNELSVSMDVITFRDMTPEQYEALYDTPTELSLPRETVSALIAAGRGVVARNAAVGELRGQ
jgi:NTE family protein